MLSIIIPLYNKEEYISKTIESILSQTYQNFEIVIVNDGSTDTSVEKVKCFDDKRIRLIEQKNAGVSAARNRGIAESKYDLIAFLDADDQWLPNHLEELLDLKVKFTTCKVFAANYKIVDPSGKERFPVNTDLFSFNEADGVIEDYFHVATSTAPPLWTSAILVNKKAIQEVGGFPLGIRLGEDLLVWALLASKNKIAYTKKITAIYNFSALTDFTDNGPLPDEKDVVGDQLKLLLSTDSKKKSLRQYISLWHRMRYNLYINNFDRRHAFEEIVKALYFNSRLLKNYILLLLLLLPHSLRTMLKEKRLTLQEKKLS